MIASTRIQRGNIPMKSGRVDGFSAAFVRVLGADALEQIKAAVASSAQPPLVLIAGDQCTGKGTAAAGLVAARGGSKSGTGSVLRAMAADNRLSIEQMSALLSGQSITIAGKPLTLASLKLGTAADVDVRLDHRAALAIASGKAPDAKTAGTALTVFESRLAGHLGTMLRDMGRQNLVSVYLAASPKVQAERYLKREFWPVAAVTLGAKALAEAQVRADQTIDALPKETLLTSAMERLLDDSALRHLDVTKQLLGKLKGIAARDGNDRSRMQALYGVDYQDRTVFDVVIHTDDLSEAQVTERIQEAVKKLQSASSRR
jgi:cytidylate kinase